MISILQLFNFNDLVIYIIFKTKKKKNIKNKSQYLKLRKQTFLIENPKIQKKEKKKKLN